MGSIFSPTKLPWFISLILSVIYFITFLAAAADTGGFASSLLFGFCVWGSPSLPNEQVGCKDSPINSHIIAFGIDFILTIAVFFIYKRDHSKKKSKLTYFAFGAIILVHGFLHFFLNSPIIDCYVDTEKYPGLEQTGYLLFGIFTFFLCNIILGVGNGSWSGRVVIESVIFTALVIYITVTIGSGDFILTGLFCVVHPISSVAALRSDNPQFTKTAGWWFVIATTVGILELLTCASFFRAIGGHFYYDLTLHFSILFSLPYYVKDVDDEKKMK